MAKSFERNPPKSVDSIRSKLTSMQGKSTAKSESKSVPTSGPLINGYAADHQITIATFHNREVAKAFQQRLSQAGVFSKLLAYKQGAIINVDAEDSQAAAKLYTSTREEFPDARTIRSTRRFDYLIFGVLLGLACATVFLVDEWTHPLAATAGISFCVIGGLLGHLIDRIRLRIRRRGRFGVGVWEFLIIATLPALIYFLSQTISNLLWD